MTKALPKLAFFSFLFLCAAGCGDGISRVDIEGVVTCGGKPVDNATVQLTPQQNPHGISAIGRSDSLGKFTVISSVKDDKGLPPGTYTARVTRLVNIDGTVLPADAADADYPDSFESVPPPYSTTSSPIQVTVSDKGGELKIEIPGKLLVKRGKL
jgi:hypothetical protein